MNTETWKPVVGWESLYEVSDTGRVRRIGAAKKAVVGKILVPSIDKKGYPTVYLSQHPRKRSAKVHRLVAEAFIPPTANKPQVNHVDGDKTNNHISNLEWCNNSENQLHAYRILNVMPRRGEMNGMYKHGRYVPCR